MLQLATVRVNAKHLHMLCHAEWNSVVAIAFFLNFFITCVKTTLDISYAGCVLCYSVQICHVMCSLENPSVSTLFTCLPLHVLSVLSYAPKMCSPLWQCWEGAWGFVHVPQSLCMCRSLFQELLQLPLNNLWRTGRCWWLQHLHKTCPFWVWLHGAAAFLKQLVCVYVV